ncbi:hypothetical protein WA1_16360 [Scytonema hofmannii PCC 7110]|uniref:Uncharacterized protein n=1 Tax=Scytonema hofmannii PCC 7110 TaxID=128403 RepID=A0A139XAB0_9CYAN|nr:hypothetical protein [Scytonema hofmannii]KYC41621.1 hypothetical protein WA1_16360 [Scytonema hofmannii PCC 7110]
MTELTKTMSALPLTNILLILGIVFLTISVIGQSRLGFMEINPGFFGRVLALIIGLLSLGSAAALGLFPVEMIDLVRTSVSEFIQQNLGLINQFIS